MRDINLSLSEGIFPSSFKQALVQPLLKKSSLSTDDLNNFRPISNLNFISKIHEKVVASRIQSHLSSNSLSSSFQSAYRIFHSTETTLLKIHNDLILAMDRGEVTSLILLDLSAADHSILLTRLQHWLVLMVFRLIGSHLISHLALRQSQSMIPSLHSLLFSVVYPKTPYLAHSFLLSILLLLARCSQKIPSNTICVLMTPSCTSLSLLQILLYVLKHLPPLSLTFFPGWTWTNCSSIHQKLNFFLLAQNNSVSNFLILQTYLSAMISSQSVSFARNLGFIFDSDMSFSEQINSVSKSCHFHIRDIRRIRHLLPLSAATALANSLVSSKLDYCNSLYSGISQSNLNKLQRIQNSLARVITNTSKYQHITPTLKTLHWLPIKQRIDYKLCLLTYKTQINNLHIFTIVFHFRHTLFLHDLLIHSFFPFHMSDHHLAKGLSLSLVHDFGIHYLLIPEIRTLYQLSVPGSKHTSSKLHSPP